MSKRHVPYFDKLKSRWRVEIGGRNFWCGKDQATAIKLTNALDSFWETEIVGVNGKKSWSNQSIVEAYNRVGMTPPASVNLQQPAMAQAAIIQPPPVALTLGPRFRPAFQPREISFHDALDVYVEMRLAKRTIRRPGEDSEQIIGSLKHHLADMPLQDIDAAVHRILTDKIINLPPNRTTGKPISIVTARWWLRELGAAFEWFSHPDSRIGWIPPYPQWREKFSINDEEAKALAKNVGDENFGKVKPIFNLDQLAILHKCTTPLDRLYLLGGVCLGWTAIEFATLKRSQIQTDQDGETYFVNKERSKTGVEMTFWVCPELAELLKQFVAATPPNPGDLAMMTRNRQGEPLPLVHNGTDTISQSWHRLLRRVNKTEKRVPLYPHSRLRKLAGQLVENITGNHDLAQMVLSHKGNTVARASYVALDGIIGVGKSPQQRLWDAQREVHKALASVLASLPPTAKKKISVEADEGTSEQTEIAA